MKPRHLLLIDAHGLSLWRESAGQAHAEARFAADAAGQAAFASHLRQHRLSRCVARVDLAEESLITDSQPVLRGNARKMLVDRKLARFFPETPFTRSQRLSLAATAPGQEHTLFAGINRPSLLTPWLNALAAAGIACPLHGAAQEAAELARALGLTAARQLLITRHGRRLRQNLIIDGHTVFSRLTTLPGGTENALEHGEIARLRHYLADQRLIEHGEALPITLIAPAATLAEASDDLPDSGSTSLSWADAARQLGLADEAALEGGEIDKSESESEREHERDTTGRDDPATRIRLHLLASAPPGSRYATPGGRIGSGWTRHLALAGGIALLAASSFAAFQWQDTARGQADTAREKAEHLRLHQDIHQLRAPLASSPLPPETLQRIHQQDAALRQQRGTPEPLFHALSQALDAHPSIVLEHLDWKNGLGSPSTAASPPAPTQGLRDTLMVQGHTARGAPASVLHFIEQLRRQPGLTLRILATAPASSDGGERFTLELSREPGR